MENFFKVKKNAFYQIWNGMSNISGMTHLTFYFRRIYCHNPITIQFKYLKLI